MDRTGFESMDVWTKRNLYDDWKSAILTERPSIRKSQIRYAKTVTNNDEMPKSDQFAEFAVQMMIVTGVLL